MEQLGETSDKNLAALIEEYVMRQRLVLAVMQEVRPIELLRDKQRVA
jgi:hypothetical protein